MLLPYIARPRVVRDTRIFGSYRHNGTACVPLRTSNFITRDQVSVTYMKPSSTSGVDSSLPRIVPPVERPPIENVYLSWRLLTVSRLISLSEEWRELS